MENEWEEITLGQLVKAGGGIIQTGPFGSQLHASDYVDQGIPVIMPVNLIDDRVNISDIAKISKHDAERLSKHLVQSGDIVYSRRGDVTRKALIREAEAGMFCGTGCLLVRPGNHVNSQFLKYHLSTPENQEWIIRHAIGATMPNLNTSILSKIPLRIPNIKLQDRIAAILGTLDDKIELNRQINTTLESMAQALFKSWFVDFDPVIDNALAAGHPIPEELQAKAQRRAALGDQRQPLPAEIQKLFPSSFVFNEEMGWVPEGWAQAQWRDIAELKYGKSLKGYRDGNGSVPVFGTNGPVGYTDHALCNHEGIIIGRKGAYRGVKYSATPFFVIDTAFYIEPILPISMKWAYYEISRFDINSMDSGSAIPSTSRDDFYNLWSVVPSETIHKEFDQLISLLYKRREINESENATLSLLRDSLLPKLLSGQLQIPDAEAAVENALETS
ncbi:restriction endonuclease subunit S [Hahella sp. KA22]|uniref:restriction endonuclease subunit S n=1 Tax=Hahella sp. KA22 TaxID=1628392 RepID=UPI000FDF29D1|nr:restriction endonuclease subunit S [Hahella sp. KA22]AZZ90641.1 restriction endonuclease subunit S [Hahella sp. KA22]QAY54012.1 restriction endonuclease subunit S [Hahella sp. KA22]